MDNNLKSLKQTDDEITVANYIVLFNGKDLAGEFFTKNTRFDSNYTDLGLLYVDFEHGYEHGARKRDPHSSVMGTVNWKTARVDDKGIFVERVLNRRFKYVQYLADLIDAGVIGTSSEAIGSEVTKKSTGEITQWPLMRDTLTATPMEPRMLDSNVLTAAKSLMEELPFSKSLRVLVGEKVEDDLKLDIEDITNLKTAERYLRDSGLSRSQATAFMSRMKSVANNPIQSDSDIDLQIAEMAKSKRFIFT